jgi:hypothetical protein
MISASPGAPYLTGCRSPKTVKYDQVFLKTWSRANSYYLQKYVQTPTNMYFTFFKSIGHDDRDCRDYDLMHERLKDIYKNQGQVQQEGSIAQYNSPRRGNFNPRGGF